MSSHARTLQRIVPTLALETPPARAARTWHERGDGRTATAAALALLLILPLGLSDGGYFGRSSTALTVALAAGAGLGLLRSRESRVSGAFVATTTSLGLLAAWVALSSAWAVGGAAVEPEVRRCVLYTAALGAIGVLVGPERRRVFLVATTAAIAALLAVGVGMRIVSGEPLDPFYGSLLSEPVGYPNAMGVLAAIAAVLAIGLAGGGGPSSTRLLHALAPVTILVLGLTGSRGGALALVAGLAVLVALSDRTARAERVGTAMAALTVGGCAWALVATVGSDGVPLAGAAAMAAAIGARLPTPGRRASLALLCGLALGGALLVAAHPPSTTSSFRSAYWAAALAEAHQRPLLGSGAGSFYLTWRARRQVETEVRDAHSLYVESLSELGPLGLALVLTTVVVPLGAAVRRRGDPLAAAAAGGLAVFAVHAGLDWDWEMPVVTLVGLGCAGTLLVLEPGRPKSQTEEKGRTR